MVLLLPGEKKVGSRQVSEFTGTHLEHKPFFVTHETKWTWCARVFDWKTNNAGARNFLFLVVPRCSRNKNLTVGTI